MRKLQKKELKTINGGDNFCPYSMVVNCLLALDASQNPQICYDAWNACKNGGLPQPDGGPQN